MMAWLDGQNQTRRNSERQSLWAAPAWEQPEKQKRTSAHKRLKHHTHNHNNIEIKRGERHNQMQKSVFH
jgi:hypothetical protein